MRRFGLHNFSKLLEIFFNESRLVSQPASRVRQGAKHAAEQRRNLTKRPVPGGSIKRAHGESSVEDGKWINNHSVDLH
jgi:hypothetical protein